MFLISLRILLKSKDFSFFLQKIITSKGINVAKTNDQNNNAVDTQVGK